MQDAPYMTLPRDPVRVPLGRTPRLALIDASDAALVVQYRWYFSNGYAVMYESGEGEHLHRPIPMARLLLGRVPGDGVEVDHINLNRLDNRRPNLRVVTKAENDQNRPRASGTSAYRGVSYIVPKDRWRAGITANGKQMTIGSFDTEMEAARAAEAARRAHMPGAMPIYDLDPVGDCPCHRCRPPREPQPCKVESCTRPAGPRRGFCNPHYARHLRYGDVLEHVPVGELSALAKRLARAERAAQ